MVSFLFRFLRRQQLIQFVIFPLFFLSIGSSHDLLRRIARRDAKSSERGNQRERGKKDSHGGGPCRGVPFQLGQPNLPYIYINVCVLFFLCVCVLSSQKYLYNFLFFFFRCCMCVCVWCFCVCVFDRDSLDLPFLFLSKVSGSLRLFRFRFRQLTPVFFVAACFSCCSTHPSHTSANMSPHQVKRLARPTGR